MSPFCCVFVVRISDYMMVPLSYQATPMFKLLNIHDFKIARRDYEYFSANLMSANEFIPVQWHRINVDAHQLLKRQHQSVPIHENAFNQYTRTDVFPYSTWRSIHPRGLNFNSWAQSTLVSPHVLLPVPSVSFACCSCFVMEGWDSCWVVHSAYAHLTWCR